MTLVFGLSSCKKNEHHEMIEDAVDELKSAWDDLYDKSDDTEEFKDIDYIIEFVLYTDYYGSAPYYSWAGISDSVVVYDDGDMEVSSPNLSRWYSTKHYSHDYSDIIRSVKDYGDQYNCVETL